MRRFEKLVLLTGAVCVVILIGMILSQLLDRPYSENSARHLYEKNEETFDTLSRYYMNDPKTRSVSEGMLQEAQTDQMISEPVRSAMQTYLNLRLRSNWHQIEIMREPYYALEPKAVMFCIYCGVDNQTSYGGEYVQCSQYLVYAPEDPDKALYDNPSYSFQEIIEISEDWYLVMDLGL